MTDSDTSHDTIFPSFVTVATKNALVHTIRISTCASDGHKTTRMHERRLMVELTVLQVHATLTNPLYTPMPPRFHVVARIL